ncbi:hypothetical protein LLG95_14575 [bacterium]|nr:hypothetical protein [bacterium]
MATGPNLKIFSAAKPGPDKLLETLFTPPEFFEFAWGISYAMNWTYKITDERAKPILEKLKKLTSTTAADSAEMNGYFLSYCELCAKSGEWVKALSGKGHGWTANPKDFDHGIRIFVSRFIFHNSEISRRCDAGEYLMIFKMLKYCLQKSLEYLNEVEQGKHRPGIKQRLFNLITWPFTLLVSKSTLNCKPDVCATALAKADRLLVYLEKAANEGAVFTFDPPPDQITKTLDLGNGTSIGMDDQGRVYMK